LTQSNVDAGHDMLMDMYGNPFPLDTSRV
jgi:hypothetical protein